MIHADEGAAFDGLHARYVMARINHEEAYSKDGACTNQAESFFSRMRRAEVGIHHHIAGLYLRRYAAEMGWREDRRVTDNSRLTSEVVALTMESTRNRGAAQAPTALNTNPRRYAL